MKLKSWMKKHNLRVVPIAELIGVSVDAVYAWFNDPHRMPRAHTMKRIRSITGGKVQPKDFWA